MTPDPMIALRERFKAHMAATRGSVDDADTEPQLAMENEAMRTSPTTVVGAIAALEWAAEEVRDGYGCDPAIAAGSLSLTLIASAIELLHQPALRVIRRAVGAELLDALDMVECARLAAGAIDQGEAVVAVLGEVKRKLYRVDEALSEQLADAASRGLA